MGIVANIIARRAISRRVLTRKKQFGFVNIGLMAAALFGRRFKPQDLFKAGEPGVHFEAYDPNSLLQRRNQFTYSEFPQGTTNLASAGALVTGGTIPGYDGAIAVGYDGTGQLAYKAVSTAFVGAIGTFSLVVKMDDGGAPSFGSATANSGLNDFFIVQGASSGSNPLSYTVTALGGGTYRVSETRVIGSSTSFGIQKGSGNSNRTFKTTAWQLDVNAPAATAYQKVTDWNTEYMAAALEQIGMWQDSLTPVTGVEQPVGWWFDKRLGSAWTRGPQLFASPADFSSASWTPSGAGVSVVGTAVVFSAAASGQLIYQTASTLGLTVGDTFEFKITVSSISGGAITGRVESGSGGSITAPGTYTVRVQYTATDGSGRVGIRTVGTTTATVTLGEIRKIAGNHATQSSNNSRPVLSARCNLITKSEQLADAAWTASAVTPVGNVSVAPDGKTTATKLVEDSTSAGHFIRQSSAIVNGSQVVATAHVKAAERALAEVWAINNSGTIGAGIRIDLTNGAFVSSRTASIATLDSYTIEALPSGWYRVRVWVTMTSQTTACPQVNVIATGTATSTYVYAGDGSSGIYAWGLDLRTSDDAGKSAPPYQRVNTSTDYDTAGFPHYLRFDGFDDSLVTNNIDFSVVSKVAVWAGVTKGSDSTAGIVVELTANTTTTDGGWLLSAPNASSANTFSMTCRGTVQIANYVPSGYASPVTKLLTALFDTAGATTADQVKPYVNGVLSQVGSTAGPTSPGNFASSPVYIGRRNNATVPFNGRLSFLSARGSTTPSSEAFITKMNRYAANLMAVTI